MIGNQLSLLELVCLAAFLTLLMLAAIEDVQTRRISNRLNGALAVLYPFYVLATPAPVAWGSALAVSGAVFLVGLILFARGGLGGGDVKLITAVSLWAGLDHFASFALVTSLTGGMLALVVLAWQRWGWMYVPLLMGWRSSAAAAGEKLAREPPEAAAGDAAPPRREPVTLPYGVAIAAGGCVVAFQLMSKA